VVTTKSASAKVPAKTAKGSAPAAAPKRTRRSREEGKRLLLEAAQKLLETTDPDHIGIRDVGELAGVHHRFVMEWFGGKVALFRAVHDSRANTMSQLIATATEIQDKKLGNRLESIRHEIVLVNWLIMNDSEFKNLEDAFPSLVGTRRFLVDSLKISETDANKASQIIGSIVVAEAMLQPHLKVDFNVMDLIVHYIESINPANKKR
jgi:AcrR family transcriptional regulator